MPEAHYAHQVEVGSWGGSASVLSTASREATAAGRARRLRLFRGGHSFGPREPVWPGPLCGALPRGASRPGLPSPPCGHGFCLVRSFSSEFCSGRREGQIPEDTGVGDSAEQTVWRLSAVSCFLCLLQVVDPRAAGGLGWEGSRVWRDAFRLDAAGLRPGLLPCSFLTRLPLPVAGALTAAPGFVLTDGAAVPTCWSPETQRWASCCCGI